MNSHSDGTKGVCRCLWGVILETDGTPGSVFSPHNDVQDRTLIPSTSFKDMKDQGDGGITEHAMYHRVCHYCLVQSRQGTN